MNENGMDTRPRELSLFSGAGGGLLGTKLLGWRPVCYVEKDKYCQRVLRARIADGYLDDAPIWDDITTFDGRPWRGCVDVVTAGFPCQPFSLAGQRKGGSDGRNMWPATARIVRDVGPEVVLLENVPGLLSDQYMGTVQWDLAEIGYSGPWDCVPASAIGANHRRDRLWFVAHTNSERLAYYQRKYAAAGTPGWGIFGSKDSQARRREWWAIEPDVVRVVYGLPFGLDRVRALGQAQVPAVVRSVWKLLNPSRQGER